MGDRRETDSMAGDDYVVLLIWWMFVIVYDLFRAISTS